jgi:epoxide hydrolase
MAGADIGYLKALAAYWDRSFDWRLQERRLNSFTSFTGDVGGPSVHFVPEREAGPDRFA